MEIVLPLSGYLNQTQNRALDHFQKYYDKIRHFWFLAEILWTIMSEISLEILRIFIAWTRIWARLIIAANLEKRARMIKNSCFNFFLIFMILEAAEFLRWLRSLWYNYVLSGNLIFLRNDDYRGWSRGWDVLGSLAWWPQCKIVRVPFFSSKIDQEFQEFQENESA